MSCRYYGLFKDERSMWIKFYALMLISFQAVLWVVWFGYLLRNTIITIWVSAKNRIESLVELIIMATKAFFSGVAWRGFK